MHDNPIRSRKTFDSDLAALRDNVLRLQNLVDTAIGLGLRTLAERDDVIARQVIQEDKIINQLRYEIEEECYRLIATQQPLASDLRSIVTAIHIVVELERIGDYAAGMCKLALELNQEPLLKPLVDLPRMVNITRQMLTDSIDAYLNLDIEAAAEISTRDNEVDDLNDQIYRELLSFMLQDPQNIQRATYLLWVSHNVERMADRVCNICERIMFMVSGAVRAKKELDLDNLEDAHSPSVPVDDD